jgi:dihydrofolate reductase
VAIAGGAATLNQYLSLGAIDELRLLHVVPITLGAGERVFDGVTGSTFGISHVRPTEHAVHVTLRPAGR